LVLDRKDDPIIALTYLNPFSIAEAEKEKTIIMDIKVKTKKGELIDIEMQVDATDIYINRSVFYGCKQLTKGLERGEVRDPDNQRKRKTKLQHDIEIMDNVIKNKIKEKEQLNSEIEPMRSEKAFYDSVIEDNRLLRDEVDEKEKKIKALSLKATENWNLYQGEKLKTSELEEKIKELVYGKEYDRTY